MAASQDTSPLVLSDGDRSYRVLDRLAIGSVCSVYRCRFDRAGRAVEGVFKVARDARVNPLLVNEAAVLRRLHESASSAVGAGSFAPFLPAVEASFGINGGDDDPEAPRQGNVLRMDEDIRSPGELHSLAEVRAHHPTGLDARNVAWIWRRLLSVLGFVHAQDVVHAAVLPMHVLVEPRGHKLLLVDWCCAAANAARDHRPPVVITGGFVPWYKRQGGLRQPVTAALDIGLAARSMIDLLGGDPVRLVFPRAVEPAMQRYFTRCCGSGAGSTQPDARRLLDDFDHLIDALWGRRRFTTFDMPPRGGAGDGRPQRVSQGTRTTEIEDG